EVTQHWAMDINRMFDIEGHESDAGSSDEYSGHYRGTDDEYDDVDDIGPEAREQGAADAAYCKESGGINDVASGTTSRQVVANDFLDGPQGRLLRYGALSGLMNLVARLGSEDPAEFVVAREGIATLVEDLQRRAYRRVGSQLGLSMPPALKDPPVSKTKGARRKGKEVEPEPSSKCEIPTKRRCCTSCGVHGHTKRTCTWHRAHRGPDTDGGAVPGCAECSSGMGSAPSATLRDKSAGRFQ
ncbi:hypothetical protein HN51_068631, partial [Arachis hypogaea]